MALVLAAAVLHAAWNFATRRSRGNLPALWLSLLLAGLASLPFAVWLAVRDGLSAQAWMFFAATGGIHALYFSLLAKAYEGSDISLVYPIARGTGVALTAVLAVALGVDRIGVLAAIGIAAVACGIGMMGLGHGASAGRHSKAFSVLLALSVGLTIMLYSLTDKLAVSSGPAEFLPGGGLHPIVYICAMFLGAAVFMAPYALWRSWRGILPALRGSKRYVLTIGPASLVTYLLILLAYQLGPVSCVVAFREFAVVIGSVLGFTLLHEEVTAWKVLGIAVIAVGLVLIKVG